ncbi:MAG TPA: response regulator [Casimicrobiaceae bacterium]|nr:response regulator [Casimicrobiaceae bacterium]
MRLKPSHASRQRWFPLVAAYLSIAAGAIALAGWVFDVHLLRSVLPGAVEMKANTAIGLLAAGIALALLATESTPIKNHCARAAGAFVTVIGFATLGEYVFGWQLGIDELVFRDTGIAYNALRGRMSPLTAAAFAGAGAALVAAPSQQLRWLVWTLAVLIAALGTLSTIGYLWDAGELVTDRWIPPIALNTAICFALLGAGVFIATMDPANAHMHGDSWSNATRQSSIEIKVLAGFVAAIVLVTVGGGLTYRASVALAESTEALARTQDVRTALGQLYTSVADAESAQRRYLLTAQPEAVSDFAVNVYAAGHRERLLTRLLQDSVEQQRNLTDLRTLVKQRLASLARGILQFDAEGDVAVRRLAAAGTGPVTMRGLRALTERMDRIEADLLEARQERYGRTRQLTLAAMFTTLVVASGLLAVLFRAIHRQMREREDVARYNNVHRRALLLYAGAPGRTQMLQGLLDLLAGTPPFVAAAFYTLDDDEGDRLLPEASAGVLARSPQPVARGEGPIGEALQSGRGAEGPVEVESDGTARANQAHVLAYPVIYRERKLGVLAAATREPPSERERAFIEGVARQFGVAVSNLEHTEDLRRMSNELAGKNQSLHQHAIALVEASRLKSEFLATMSHELRTPLNAIIGFAEVLHDRLAGDLNEQQSEYVGDIMHSGEHLLELINDILDLSKIEAGRMDLSVEPIEMLTLAKNALAMIKEKALAHRLRVELDVPPDLPPVWADRRRIKQILYNLLSNAVKFTPDGGSVTLRARRSASDQGEDLELSVIDTGIGISPEDQGKLFQAFMQIDSSLSKNFEGTGLGLAMVKRLAELHGGRVSVESAEGHGSTFTVFLPLRRAEPLPQAAASSDAPALAAHPPLALVLEDDPRAAELLRLQLETMGLEVLHASNGEGALHLARERRPDVITLDVLLPGMDGWEFLDALKADPALAAIPVVIISILSDTKKGLALGASFVLQKPVDREELLAAMQALNLVPGSGRMVRVLVIDDDPSAVEIVSTYLSAAGYGVAQAYHGRDGIDMARTLQPDVIVLDLLMPELSGFDVVDKLQGDRETDGIPIVVVTAKSLTQADRHALNGQVTRILDKTSFKREHLIGEVRRALSPTRRP